MGWAIGYDHQWNRFRGYEVPSECEHPDCDEDICRGVDSLCSICGLSFCYKHLLSDNLCSRCEEGEEPFEPKPETDQWIDWIATHESWQQWRDEKQSYTHDQIRNCFGSG